MVEDREMGEEQVVLQTLSWSEVVEPGAYVEVETGDLYRIPSDALQETEQIADHLGAARLVLISTDPYISTMEARLRCARLQIDPNF